MVERKIRTKTVNRNVAKADPIKLVVTPETRVGFVPTLTPKGVRGKLVKYRKTRSGEWQDLKQKDFENHSLKPSQKVTIDLSTEATAQFLHGLKALEIISKQGIQSGETDYVVSEVSKTFILNDANKAPLLKQILEKGFSEEFWDLLSGNEPDLADRLARGRIQQARAETISILVERLTKDYAETSGEDSWQKWIFENHWLFGANYQKPIEKQKVNLPGSMPDYLFPSIDGFIDLLEIKLPKHDVIKTDPSHRGSFVWTPHTNKAIGQVAFYLSEINRLQLEIEKLIFETENRRISMLKPRAYILIGNSKSWSELEHKGLRRLNDTLHGIEVLTYQELVQRGNTFLGVQNAGEPAGIDEIDIPF